jgi:hypothetical protein
LSVSAGMLVVGSHSAADDLLQLPDAVVKLGHGTLTAIVAVCLIGGIGCFVAALLVGIWVDGALAENLGGTAVVLAATGMFLGRAL